MGNIDRVNDLDRGEGEVFFYEVCVSHIDRSHPIYRTYIDPVLDFLPFRFASIDIVLKRFVKCVFAKARVFPSLLAPTQPGPGAFCSC